MDNLKYYNDSLAYDFNLFMPKPAQEVKTDNVIKMPKKKNKTRKRQSAATQAAALSVSSVLIVAFLVAAVCGSIFLRVKITEVGSQINDVNAEINELDAQLTKLNVEYENKISYTGLEKSASELGMKKMDKNQVVYIRVNDKNAAVTQSGEKVISEE